MKFPYTDTHIYAANPDEPRKLEYAFDKVPPSVKAKVADKSPRQILPGVYVGSKSQVRTLQKLQANYVSQSAKELDAWVTAGNTLVEDRAKAGLKIKGWLSCIRPDVRLELQDLGLTSVPKLPHQVRELNLNNNRLARLSEDIIDWENVRRLWLDKNQLTKLPDAISDLTHLHYLSLNENPIKALPIQIGNLTRLEELWLGKTYVKELPSSIVQLSGLKNLNIANTPLVSLPNDFGKLRNLNCLVLLKNRLQSLPASLWTLTNLTRLVVCSNKVQELPKELGNLRHLTDLTFSGADIKQVPAEIGQLGLLEELELVGNKLTDLPSEMARCRNLYSINLAFNNFTKVPRFLLTMPRVAIPKSPYDDEMADGYIPYTGPQYRDSIIDLSDNPIPAEEIAAVKADIAQLRSQGQYVPEFIFSNPKPISATDVRPIQEVKGTHAPSIDELTLEQTQDALNATIQQQKELNQKLAAIADVMQAETAKMTNSATFADLGGLLNALENSSHETQNLAALDKRIKSLEERLWELGADT